MHKDTHDHLAQSASIEALACSYEPPTQERDFLALKKLRSETQSELQPVAPIKDKDIVDVSVFAPNKVAPDTAALVQVFFHLLDQSELARDLAQEADPLTKRRGVKTLTTEIGRGQQIDVVLECPALEVLGDEVQSIVWHGRPSACQFIVVFPKAAVDKASLIRVRIMLNSIPIGFIAFSLDVSNSMDLKFTEIRGDERRRYRYAFLSHASGDRAEVLKRAQALTAVGIDYFHDLASLKPGDRWQPKLYEEIDRCDLFLLFWSSLAARSEWVRKETNTHWAAEGRQTACPTSCRLS